MKNIVLNLVFLFSICQVADGQGNLQFFRVFGFVNGDNYTIPAGKVLKLESFNSSTVNYSLPLSGCYTTTSSTGCGGPCTYNHCQYSASNYLIIGGLSFSATSAETGGLGGCNNCPPLSSSLSLATPNLTFPIWLKAGDAVYIAPGSGLLLPGIEFNITP